MIEILSYFPLAPRVLTVAVRRHESEGAWTCYIDAVPGIRHKVEVQSAAENGQKLPEEIARILFPQYLGPYISR